MPEASLSLFLQKADDDEKTRIQAFSQFAGDGSVSTAIDLPNTDLIDKWIHVAVTLDGSTLSIQVNGENTQSREHSGTLAAFSDFHIGTIPDTNRLSFQGLVDEFAIWNRILTSEELLNLAQPPIVVTTSEDEDDGEMSLNSLDDISLREAINHAPEGARITFAFELILESTITLTEGQLVIDKSLVIDIGDLSRGSVIIDANGQTTNHRIMEIRPGHRVAISGLRFAGGNAISGGAIYNDNSDLVLEDCTFLTSSAEEGGGIFSDNSSSAATKLTIANCNFFGNFASNSGGGIWCAGTSFLTSCRFYNNTADRGGAISANPGEAASSLFLKNCLISDNSASEGGGIYSDGNTGLVETNLNNCMLVDNSAEQRGGGIYSNGSNGGSVDLSLVTSTLSNNSAQEDGGGIFSDGSSGGDVSLIMNTSTVSKNTARSGGGIFNLNGDGRAVLSLDDSTLSENSADLDGGGIFSSGSSTNHAGLDLKNCTLFGNSANRNGGGICSSFESAVELTFCTLSENSAITGGGIYSAGVSGDSTLAIHQSIISGNRATDTSSDLAIESTSLSTSGVNLVGELGNSGLTASSEIIVAQPRLASFGDYGGPTQTAHPLDGSPAVLFLADNTRTDQRGYIVEGPPTIGAVKIGPISTVMNLDDSGPNSLRQIIAETIDPATIIRFDAGLNGQTITLTEGQFLIDQSLVIDASTLPDGLTIDANDTGRIMQIAPSHSVALLGLHLTGGKAFGDSTERDGGAIYNNGANLTLIDCHLSENNCNWRGGAIFNRAKSIENARLTLRRCSIQRNSALLEGGGGIMNEASNSAYATVILERCTISGNSGRTGGGIYSSGLVNGKAAMTLDNCTIVENVATSFGGGIASRSGTDGSNRTSASPGTSSLILSSCTISKNFANYDGGGIWVHHNSDYTRSTPTIGNSIIADNTTGILAPDLSQSSVVINILKGNNLIGNNSGSNVATTDGIVGTDSLPINPRLAPLGDYGGSLQTMPLLAGSPAIDAAGDRDPGGTDQRGFSRFVNGMLDIGAVELGPINLVVNRNDSGEGSLRQAISEASLESAAVHFAPSLSGETISLVGGQLLVDKALVIDASNLPDGITIDATSPNTRVLKINNGYPVTLVGLKLTGGNVSSSVPPENSGGAIYNDSNLTLFECHIFGNLAELGGGIYNNQGATLSIINSIFLDNSAGHGGGIFSNGNSILKNCRLIENSATDTGGGILTEGLISESINLKASNCILSGNSASSGGGIFNKGLDGRSIVDIDTCTLSGNFADANGGGILNEGRGEDRAILNIISSTLSGNTALEGGAIHSSGIIGSAVLDLDSCTLSGNSAGMIGGGILLDATATLLENCTLSANEASGQGGGIFLSGPSSLTLLGSIVSGNRSPGTTSDLAIDVDSDESTIIAGRVNLIGELGNSGLSAGNTIIVSAPLLAPLGDYGGPTQTMMPLPYSPAIDADSRDYGVQFDQRGFQRRSNHTLDIGAVEIQGAADYKRVQAHYWAEDLDGDGFNLLHEFALGTDPRTPDFRDSRNAKITDEGYFSFGKNPRAYGTVQWIIQTSSTLDGDWDDSTETYSTGLPEHEYLNIVQFRPDPVLAIEPSLFFRLVIRLTQ